MFDQLVDDCLAIFQYLTAPVIRDLELYVSTQLCPRKCTLLQRFLLVTGVFIGGVLLNFFVFRSEFETGGGNKTEFLLDFLFISHNGGEKGRYGQSEARSQRLLRRNAELSKLDLATSVKPKIIVSFISPPTPQ